MITFLLSVNLRSNLDQYVRLKKKYLIFEYEKAN